MGIVCVFHTWIFGERVGQVLSAKWMIVSPCCQLEVDFSLETLESMIVVVSYHYVSM